MANKGNIPWNKGLTKEINKSIEIIGLKNSISLKGRISPKRKYSFNENDWKIKCCDCGNIIIYKSRDGFRNAIRGQNSGRKIRCGSCKQIGKNISKETRKKQSISAKKRFENLEEREKQSKRCRISAINRIMKTHGHIYPNYNINACKIIEDYGKENGYDFQHALNGGEVNIDGYFPDGLDEEKKTIIEIDETHHFDINGNLREKDIIRQKYLENLEYKIIRIRI